MPRLLRLSDVRATAEGIQPPGYRLRGRGQLNLGLLSVLSLVALPIALLAFALLTAPLGGPLDLRGGVASFAVGPLDILLLLVAALIILPVVHELVHGAVAWTLGGRPVYGIGPGVAFCHFREFVGKWPYAAILIAPLLVISLGGVLLMPVTPGILRGPLLAVLVTNASGAVGDLSALWQLLRFPGDILIADTGAGFEAYEPDSAVPATETEPPAPHD
jgi:hypothetical protein